jgi:hypothetical protein
MKKIGNLDKLMSDIGALIAPTIREDEFTIVDFRTKFQIPDRTARSLLQAQVDSGVLKLRKVLIRGKYVNAYSDGKSKP